MNPNERPCRKKLFNMQTWARVMYIQSILKICIQFSKLFKQYLVDTLMHRSYNIDYLLCTVQSQRKTFLSLTELKIFFSTARNHLYLSRLIQSRFNFRTTYMYNDPLLLGNCPNKFLSLGFMKHSNAIHPIISCRLSESK